MKKKNILVFAVIAFFVTSLSAFAEYDQNKVKSVMRDNVQLMGKIGKAAKAEDFQAAGESLMMLAQGMISIQKYIPNRGSQADWDNIMAEFINAAFRGIGASGNKDIEALNTAISELRRLNSQGHKSNR